MNYIVIIVLFIFLQNLFSHDKKLTQEDYRREVLIAEYHFLLTKQKLNEASELVQKYFPKHLYERIKKEGHRLSLSKEDFNEPKNARTQNVSFEPEVKNFTDSGYDKHTQMMKIAISEYNKLVYERKLDEAMKVAQKYFPQSEIEYIKIHGHSPISSYQVKERNLVEKSELSYSKVKKIHVRETDELYNLTYEDGNVIQTTWSHPFYIIGKGWIEAKDLKVGDRSMTAKGIGLLLTKIEVQKLDKPVKVYNLELEGSHNFFVSKSSVLVHNTNGYGDIEKDTGSLSEKYKVLNKLKEEDGNFWGVLQRLKNTILLKGFLKTDLEVATTKLKHIQLEKSYNMNDEKFKEGKKEFINSMNRLTDSIVFEEQNGQLVAIELSEVKENKSNSFNVVKEALFESKNRNKKVNIKIMEEIDSSVYPDSLDTSDREYGQTSYMIPGKGSNVTIYFGARLNVKDTDRDSASKTIVTDKDGNFTISDQPLFIELAHELKHVVNYTTGNSLADLKKYDNPKNKMLYENIYFDSSTKTFKTEIKDIKKEEFYTVFSKEDNIKAYNFETGQEINEWMDRGISENNIRKEHGLLPRRSYSPVKGK